MRKKDKLGRWVKRVDGAYSEHVLSMRLTDAEYTLVKRARADGIEPRDVMVRALKDKLNGGVHDKG
jgi:hypothetical protein